MANPLYKVLLTEERLRTPGNDVDLGAGGIVDFWGVVRAAEDGREIEGIDYEANVAMAEHQMEKIARSASEKFPLLRVVLHHRTGFVAAGESSLFLRVTSKHRAEAFAASQWMVDELKKSVPIWKKPRFKKVDAAPRQSEVATVK